MHESRNADCFPETAVQGRRKFLATAGLLPIFAAFSGGPRAMARGGRSSAAGPVLLHFTGQDGPRERRRKRPAVLQLRQAGQATWQPGGIFPDGRRVIFLSMEPRRDGPGRPFEEYYTQTPTHLWIHDLETGSLEEICAKDRLAPFVTPALLLSDRPNSRASGAQKGRPDLQRSSRRDRRREFTRAGEGLPYGLSLSPDGGGSPSISRVRRATRSGPATPTVRTESASPRSRGTSISARAGRRTAAGSCTSIAYPAKIRGTTGPMSASVARMAASTECSPAESRCGSRRHTATRRRGAADRTCPHGLATDPSSSRAACRGPKFPGNSSRSAPTLTILTATTSPNCSRRNRDLPARPARRTRHRPDAQRSAGLGFPRANPRTASSVVILSGENGRASGDMGNGCQRQESSPHHTRDRRTKVPIILAGSDARLVGGDRIAHFSCHEVCRYSASSVTVTRQ